jgi:ring-1,2-phenylacetyl-CoA epoxidase subunit PaaE
MSGDMNGSSITQFLPRALRQRLAGWERDLHMLKEGLAGRQPTPVELRPRRNRSAAGAGAVSGIGTSATTSATALKPRTLRVCEVVRETSDAVTLHLVDPSGAPFAFEAGQFLTLLLPLSGDGSLERRAYSACSSPLDGARIAITSKRVTGGKVSNYLNDQATAGLLIQVLGPSGNFTPQPREGKRRRIVLIGGGSGITPLMSIAETVLRVEAESQVALIYGNRSLADIIFHRRLDALADRHTDRLTVRHVLSTPHENFTGGIGLLDEPRLEKELVALPQAELRSEYYLCGPEPMMTAARVVLLRQGIAAHHIFEERFATPRYEGEENSAPQTLELRQAGLSPRRLTVAAGETLLEAGLRAGAALPFSCALGGCGACKGRLVDGDVAMQEPNCLTQKERAQGYVLCCVARPRSAVTIEIPDASDA